MSAQILRVAGLVAHCRAGFERECVQELVDRTAEVAPGAFARTDASTAIVELVAPETSARIDDATLDWRSWTFARSVLRLAARARNLPLDDRLGPLWPEVRALDTKFCDAWVETPESDAARPLAALARALNSALVAALKRDRLLDRAAPNRLHLVLTAPDAALLGYVPIALGAPWPSGIPRLKFPSAAPSRSTLKLDEAFLVLLDDDEREKWLQPGMSAVDLGAAPGGWTYQLTRRSLRVIAVDNGPIDASLLETGLVEHRREDGFRFRPKTPVDWLVCDMVEQPRRVAALVASWLAEGVCRRAIFNLKLPMKKRYDEVQLCLRIIDDALAAVGRGADLRARQLYHDREEVTVFAQWLGARNMR